MSSIVKHAPRFTCEDAIDIARERYAIDASAEALPSERDQNFHLTAASGVEYVLKIANALDRVEVLELQNKAMMHIAACRQRAAAELRFCPEVCPDLDGGTIATLAGVNDDTHLVRLLTYLPGQTLAKTKPHDQGLLRSLGHFLGRIDTFLQDFEHPAAQRDFHWNLTNAGKVIDAYANLIKIPAKQALVQRFLDRFQSHAEPQLPALPTGIIHNDANDYNVLVEPVDKWHNRVSAVIDFGDMVHTCTVCEPAIACAYAMLNKADPLSAAHAVVAGYHATHPLTADELRVLFDLICMRLCMSVCLCAHQYHLEPDNEYLRISEQPAWALLAKLDAVHPRLAHYVLREACDLPPVPQTQKIVSWLQEKAPHFESVVDADLHSPDTLVLDMSIGSTLLGADVEATDMHIVTQRVFAQMEAAGSPVGIGRYAEARPFYTTNLFQTPAEERPIARTIHLGIDIYLPHGMPVYAPLEGRIHSFQNNSGHLDYGPTLILEHATDAGERFYTLYGHLGMAALCGIKSGMQVHKGRLLAHIGAIDVNGGWPPHLHFQIMVDTLDMVGDFPGVAAPRLRKIWTSICPDPNLILGIPKNCFPPQGHSPDNILAIRRANLGRNLSIAYRQPLKIVRGRGQYLFDDQGEMYLDGVNNVCHVGHCHPRVVAAAQAQMPVLNTNTRYLHDHIITYSQRLLAKFPAPLRVCFFVCTGSEANELALRMARTYTGQKDLISVEGAYHGNTQGLIDISPYKHDGPGGRGAPPWVHTLRMPDGYRGPHKGQGAATGVAYARYVQNAIKKIQNSGKGLAAFICESLLGCGGQIVLPDNYLPEAFRAVRQAGGLCIVDEVQVGFGRVGSHFWAFETQGVIPDIVTLGKPMGNGHPLAAVITTPEIADAFANGMEYFNTFGGNPVSCAIGMAVLDVIAEENLQANAQKAGARLLQGFEGLKTKYPLLGDVRGLGLFVGVELVTDRQTLAPAAEHADYIINRMKAHGILISTDGPLHNVLKLKPPLVFSAQNADRVVETLDKILQADCLQV